MVFSSNIFLFVFLPLVLGGYFLIHPKFRNTFLLLSSLFFYFWGEPKFVFIMFLSIFINYIFGILIYISQGKGKTISRTALFLGVFFNLALLFYYKYFDFTIGIFNSIGILDMPLKNITLPIGISFFTFQGMTYIIDLYWGNVPVQKNPLKVGLYISLFPQLIAGPIVRYKDVNAQIDNRTVNVEKFSEGIKRFVLGLGKKSIIANTVALTADNIFKLPYQEISVTTAWLGIICYTLQIYFDFSGYSDMAIGLGKMFGFDFLENFNYPYISKSITEFWRRWHISLSSFFRDYVYIPLGGNRKGNVYIHLFIVFVLTGLWHGASFNFLVWGLWHGAFIIAERVLKNTKLSKLSIPSVIKHIYTILVFVVGWVFFRAENLTYAVGYIGRMFGIVPSTQIAFKTSYYTSDKFLIFILLIAVVASTGVLSKIPQKLEKNEMVFSVAKTVYIAAVMFLCAVFVMTSTYNPFIYFRF